LLFGGFFVDLSKHGAMTAIGMLIELRGKLGEEISEKLISFIQDSQQ
jgi:hypothetical protein